MKRFTTPYLAFELELDTSIIKSLRVYFEQNDELVLTKKTEHCEMDGNDIKVRLEQEETALFDDKKHAKVQLHALTVDGDALLTDIVNVYVGESLAREVIK